MNLDELAVKELDTRLKVEALGAVNISNMSYEERKISAIEYAKARHEHCNAKKLLEDAISI